MEKKSITEQIKSPLTLILCIIYSLWTVLFIVRNCFTTRLLIMNIAIFIGMILICTAMWIAWAMAKGNKISSASTICGSIGIGLKGANIFISSLIIGVVVARIMTTVNSVLKLFGSTTIFKWIENFAEADSEKYGGGILSSATGMKAVLIAVIIAFFFAAIVYLCMTIASILFTTSVQKGRPKGGIFFVVTGAGAIISNVSFIVLNSIKYLTMRKLCATYCNGATYSTAVKYIQALFYRQIEEIENNLGSGSTLVKILEKVKLGSIKFSWGLGLGTGAFVLDIVISLLAIAAIVLGIIIVMKIEKSAKAARYSNRQDSEFDENENRYQQNEYNNFAEIQNMNDFNGYDGETDIIQGSFGYEQGDSTMNIETVSDNGMLRGCIECIAGNNKGNTYPIEPGEEIIVGKDPRLAHIIVDHDAKHVSRKHCGIKYNGMNNSYEVIDYSSNGTYIKNYQKLTKGIYISVQRGSIITLANSDIAFKLQ